MDTFEQKKIEVDYTSIYIKKQQDDLAELRVAIDVAQHTAGKTLDARKAYENALEQMTNPEKFSVGLQKFLDTQMKR